MNQTDTLYRAGKIIDMVVAEKQHRGISPCFTQLANWPLLY